MEKLSDVLKIKELKKFAAPFKEIENFEDGKGFIKKYGYPVVLKANSQEHKSEKKEVFTNIYTYEALKKAISKIKGEKIIQKQIEGVEFIVGFKKDRTFGKILMVGSGGIFTELLKDVQFRVLPIKKKEIKEAIKETKMGKVFPEFRGKKYNEKKFIELVYNLSKFFQKFEFEEADFNPIIVNGKGAYIVDARIKA